MSEVAPMPPASKPFWTSKTVWFNALSVLWLFGAKPLGLPTLDPTLFASILTVVNLILRAATKGGIAIS